MTQIASIRGRAGLAVCAIVFLAPLCRGQEATTPTLRPPDAASFQAFDRPSDEGGVIAVTWGRSPSEGKGVSYIVEIASEKDAAAGRFKEAARLPSEKGFKSDAPKYFGFSKGNQDIHYAGVEPASVYPPDKGAIRRELERKAGAAEGQKPSQRLAVYLDKETAKAEARDRLSIGGQRYGVRLGITNGKTTAYVEDNGRPKVVSAVGRPNWFKFYKVNNLVFSIAFCGIVLAFIRAARRNPNLFIRKIAGLEAAEEAIGRSTEMGRSIFFVHGLDGVGALGTIAALNILGRVCRLAAAYNTRVRVMNNDPIVLAVSQEVVKQAYTEAGRPDAYNPDDVSLVAADQFSYVAAVGGRMIRERPAAVFLMGYFYAESLLLSETGASTGAIQIAGTDAYTQVPFFVTTCDYTLIGEELYAASAYLSREPMMLGSLRGQDVGKAFLMALILAATGLLTLSPLIHVNMSWIQQFLQAF